MDYAYKTDQAVYELSKFKIQFCKNYQTYLFNNKWVNTYNEIYFQNKTDEIRSLLHNHLVNGKNHKEYLQNLLDNLGKRIDWLKENKSYSFEFFSNYTIKSIDCLEEPDSNKDIYNEFLKTLKVSNSDEPEYFVFLRLHRKKFDEYENLLDFNKGMLLYAISLYNDALIDLYQDIDKIHSTVTFIDFKNFSFNELHTSSVHQKNERRFHFNLDKKSIAHLFRILIEEEVIVFDELDEKKNLIEMKKFVEQNFTYLNDQKVRMPINTFNREYSEARSISSFEVKKHKAFIDKLTGILIARKNNLKD